jgi:hypothetical protein
VLDGASVGALAGALAGVAPWLLGRGVAIPAGLVVVGAGVLGGVVLAVRERWSDGDVALFLDARLTRNEAISTALEGADPAPGGAAIDGARAAAPDRRELALDVAREVESLAVAALTSADARRAVPPRRRRWHAALPLGLAALAALPVLPPRAPTAASEHPATDTLRAGFTALHRVEALRELPATSLDEKRKLEALANDARALREKAERGVERKEALDALARLRDALDADRGELSATRNRAGLEAAVAALSRHAETRAAARALGDADVVALDRETRRLADAAEAEARDVARKTLEEAAKAAREHGAEDVGRLLDGQKRLLERRAAESAAMRELSRLLGDALPEGARQSLQRLDRMTDGQREAMAEALVDALEGLTEEERRRVADALRRSAEGMQGENAAPGEELGRLAKALDTKAGREQLRAALKRLAQGEGTEEGRRERAMEMARLGVAEAEREATGGAPGKGAPGASRSGGSGSQSGTGNDQGGGHGQHGGQTPDVAASALPAHATGTAQGGIPIGPGPGTAPPVAAEAAGSPGVEALRAVGPKEVGAVERSDVPQEYREQVGRYFSP